MYASIMLSYVSCDHAAILSSRHKVRISFDSGSHLLRFEHTRHDFVKGPLALGSCHKFLQCQGDRG